jgi:hypothetical protein
MEIILGFFLLSFIFASCFIIEILTSIKNELVTRNNILLAKKKKKQKKTIN